MDKIKIVLDWFPNTNHAGYLLAQTEGYFKEAGLDVEFEAVVHTVMDISTCDFICGPMLSMLGNRMKGVDMTGIATMTQRCDSGIVSLKESGITRPRDLMGKRLTYWSQPWYHRAIGHLVTGDGGDYSKVNFINMNVGDIVGTLTTIADATWVYANWENEVLKDAGFEINYFNITDHEPRFDFPAPAMAASKEILTERPDLVRRLLAALDLGYRQAAADPENTALKIAPFMPEGSSEEMLVKSLKHLAPLFLDEQGRWGRIRPERWDNMANWCVEIGWYDKRRPDEFTNDFFERS